MLSIYDWKPKALAYALTDQMYVYFTSFSIEDNRTTFRITLLSLSEL